MAKTRIIRAPMAQVYLHAVGIVDAPLDPQAVVVTTLRGGRKLVQVWADDTPGEGFGDYHVVLNGREAASA